MCTVSMISDHYRETVIPRVAPWVQTSPHIFNTNVTRAEFEELKKTVLEMKELLLKAKEYDERTGQAECDTAEKVEYLKKLAEFLGVDLSEVYASV